MPRIHQYGVLCAFAMSLLVGACNESKEEPVDAGQLQRDASKACRFRLTRPGAPECPRCQPGENPAFFTGACMVGHFCEYTLFDSSFGGLECNCLAMEKVDAGTWDCAL